MKPFFLLENSIKNYAWGSMNAIPALRGLAGDGKPQAEVWMGAHPQSPSRLRSARRARADDAPHGKGAAEETISLDRFIEENPIAALGKEDSEDFGSLPFLFKFLAAEKPLSIQAHPSLEQARAGWARENAAGLAPHAPTRNYRDNRHKPEILCALTPFDAMAGFRPVRESIALLEALGISCLDPVIAAMKMAHNDATALKSLMAGLFSLNEPAKKRLFAALPASCTRLERARLPGIDCARAAHTIRGLMVHYPDDIGVLAPCYLNILHLEPGEAIFVDAGILHSYLKGLGVELMANSDNVIRGGLTPKHVDVGELMAILRFEPWTEAILHPQDAPIVRYPGPGREFCLERITLEWGRSLSLPAKGARILAVTAGSFTLKAGGESLPLERGQSAFVPASTTDLFIEGSGTLYGARTATAD